MVEKNLFPYDLAVVAILKNEGAYLKEWLDYHLLAGVDHFYLYDNDSTDNQAEVAKPYVEEGLVDYFHAPGKMMQMVIYNDAAKRFKFHCRYMAFIDGDEFIFPKSNRRISEVVDETLSRDANIAGMAIHWQCFGSNGQETADYSRGVLERFTRRASSGDTINRFIKTVANPRKMKCMLTMHFAYFFMPLFTVDENLNFIPENVLEPIAAEKIVINHYYSKSREEYFNKKKQRGWACSYVNPYGEEHFKIHDRNEVFDDGILKYRAERAKNFSLETNEERFNRVTEILTEILSAYSAGEKFSLETALTCRALSTYLREKFPADACYWKICEEASLSAIMNSLINVSIADSQLFVRELPNLLSLPYPVCRELRIAALQFIPKLMDVLRVNARWQNFVEMDYINDLLAE